MRNLATARVPAAGLSKSLYGELYAIGRFEFDRSVSLLTWRNRS